MVARFNVGSSWHDLIHVQCWLFVTRLLFVLCGRNLIACQPWRESYWPATNADNTWNADKSSPHFFGGALVREPGTNGIWDWVSEVQRFLGKGFWIIFDLVLNGF